MICYHRKQALPPTAWQKLIRSKEVWLRSYLAILAFVSISLGQQLHNFGRVLKADSMFPQEFSQSVDRIHSPNGTTRKRMYVSQSGDFVEKNSTYGLITALMYASPPTSATFIGSHDDVFLLQLDPTAIYTVFRKKVVYFVFGRNFTTTGSIFLQFSVTITEKLVYKYVRLSKIYLA